MVVAPATARLAAAQHTAWMLVDLLARTDGIVSAVHVVCPLDVPLAGRVVPLAPRTVPLADALIIGGNAIGAAPVDLVAVPADGVTVLVVGAEEHPGCRYVLGHGWWGGVADQPMTFPERVSDLPVGSYVAAALAVGEVYLRARLPEHVAAATGIRGWDCWQQCLADHPSADAPANVADLDLSGVALAGVGAVGSTWIHTLWATPGLAGDIVVADADEKGVDITNLNRCPLFGRDSVGMGKADEAARIAGDSSIAWQACDGRLEACLQVRTRPRVLVSAVDRNRAREALQNLYVATILSGSTRDLRAEVLRAGPPGVGACLRCYNPPEALVGDDELRTRLRDAGPEAIARHALDVGVAERDVVQWLGRGQCDEVGNRLIQSLRRTAESNVPTQFAVGFTSVMAGVLLAAETIKTELGRDLTTDGASVNNATFQFRKPTSSANGAVPLGRDPSCPACAPTNPALAIWRRRAEQARPGA
ncbi:ThiF family adenylyltransferase [Kutzneria chonburiensis]|uniref:ThiF family adenylyltransferase n=1 Tax=Kutzneria chonburiensis TaxID=1483604 RepID=A0ABV6MP06_9PSEU|nr:ThiF family adenylyltransferase [Kutzneria chonburiensis]